MTYGGNIWFWMRRAKGSLELLILFHLTQLEIVLVRDEIELEIAIAKCWNG